LRTYDTKDTADRLARLLYKAGNSADRYFHSNGLDRLFAHAIYLDRLTPPVHVAPSNEIGRQFRRAETLIVRLPFSRWGVAMGIWGTESRPEAEGLLAAVRPTSAPDEEELRNYDESLATQRGSAFREGVSPPGSGEGVEGGPELRVVPAGDAGADGIAPEPYTVIE
jgi:hypothetical protein